MSIYEDLKNKRSKLSVIGLGYVGLPLAIAFSRNVDVIGFDINKGKIQLFEQGIDPTYEVGNDVVKNSTVSFTFNEMKLRESQFYIIAVPTPITQDKSPDLAPVERASKIVGRNLSKGSYVVFESTVYPGVTEDICVPILERESSLKCGIDFKVGYSPERINPGDKVNTLDKIVKIVSGIDEESLNSIADVYEMVVSAGIHKAPSIKVAEAAKVAENSQRDINIAFMNELAMAFEKMEIDTLDVVNAMNTKWNALGFTPGLVGGHCIGVDPYYFIFEAEKLGYHSQIIMSGRKINDGMGEFISDIIIKKMILANKNIRSSKIAILGITFKENCPDVRNSKVVDIFRNLNDYDINTSIVDPIANEDDVMSSYGIKLHKLKDISDVDCLVFAVAHDEYKNMKISNIMSYFKNVPNNEKVIVDIKGILDKTAILEQGISYWRL